MARDSRPGGCRLPRPELVLARRGVAEVIFHVAIARHEVRDVVLRELGERAWRSDLQRKFVSTFSRPRCAMPMTISLTPRFGQSSKMACSADHERLAAFQRKPLLPHVFRVQEMLETLRLEQLAQQRDLEIAARAPESAGRALDALAQPVPHADVLDVHELEADGAGVDALQRVDHLPQLHACGRPGKTSRRPARSRSFSAKPKLPQPQKRLLRPFIGERVELGQRVADGAIGIDQALHARLQREIGQRRRGECGRRGGAISAGAAAPFGFCGKAELESLEKRGPGRLHVRGVHPSSGSIVLPAGRRRSGWRQRFSSK